VAAPNAPLLDGMGKSAKSLSLDAAVFGSEVRPHLVHETVRAELNAARAGTRGGKNRALVAGGRSKPWRQKGTGRARAGSTRAPHWTGGGMAFPPRTRSFGSKVNRKVARAALRAAHARGESLGILDSAAFSEPSTKQAAAFLDGWGQARPLVLVVADYEDMIAKSFRNLEGVAVTVPGELEVQELVGARSLLISAPALEQVQGRAT
jgi:large subunit ribosomal protein L4